MTETPAFPWERVQPKVNSFGFLASAGNIKLSFGYAQFDRGIFLLYVSESIGTQTSRIWRRVWAPAEEALEAAFDLCNDAEIYLESIGHVRPVEDLGMADFLEHLKLRINNELH